MNKELTSETGELTEIEIHIISKKSATEGIKDQRFILYNFNIVIL